jgi:hypothetical protein
MYTGTDRRHFFLLKTINWWLLYGFAPFTVTARDALRARLSLGTFTMSKPQATGWIPFIGVRPRTSPITGLKLLLRQFWGRWVMFFLPSYSPATRFGLAWPKTLFGTLTPFNRGHTWVPDRSGSIDHVGYQQSGATSQRPSPFPPLQCLS